eukprot:sb/3460581/
MFTEAFACWLSPLGLYASHYQPGPLSLRLAAHIGTNLSVDTISLIVLLLAPIMMVMGPGETTCPLQRYVIGRYHCTSLVNNQSELVIGHVTGYQPIRDQCPVFPLNSSTNRINTIFNRRSLVINQLQKMTMSVKYNVILFGLVWFGSLIWDCKQSHSQVSPNRRDSIVPDHGLYNRFIICFALHLFHDKSMQDNGEHSIHVKKLCIMDIHQHNFKMCNEEQMVLVYVWIGYVCGLILATTVVAYKTRRLPTNFNEARNRPDPEILVPDWLITSIIYGHKMYVIYVIPEENTPCDTNIALKEFIKRDSERQQQNASYSCLLIPRSNTTDNNHHSRSFVTNSAPGRPKSVPAATGDSERQQQNASYSCLLIPRSNTTDNNHHSRSFVTNSAPGRPKSVPAATGVLPSQSHQAAPLMGAFDSAFSHSASAFSLFSLFLSESQFRVSLSLSFCFLSGFSLSQFLLSLKLISLLLDLEPLLCFLNSMRRPQDSLSSIEDFARYMVHQLVTGTSFSSFKRLAPAAKSLTGANRPNQETLVPDWLITSHLTYNNDLLCEGSVDQLVKYGLSVDGVLPILYRNALLSRSDLLTPPPHRIDIVNDHGSAIDELKEIKKKNEEIAKTKKRVDIPSIVAGTKKSEIDIPHRRTKASELHGEILKRSKYNNKEEVEPVPSSTTSSTGTDPIPTPMVCTRVATETSKQPIRSRYIGHVTGYSSYVNEIIDAIRKKATDPQPPAPSDNSTSDPPSSRPSRERRRPPPPIRVEQRKAPETASAAPKAARSPTRETRRSRPTTPLTPDLLTPPPHRIDIVNDHGSAIDELKEIKKKNEEIAKTKKRVDIPSISGTKKSEIDIPHRRTKASELHGEILKRSKYNNKEEVEPVPNRTTSSTGTDPIPTPMVESSIPPNNPPSLPGRAKTPDYHYRIRRDSEGSVEVGFIEEHSVETEWQAIRSRRTTSSSTEAPRAAPAGSSLPRGSSFLGGPRRKIIVDRCADCEGGDSPPEIEIRICKKGRCPKHEPETDLSLYSTNVYNTDKPALMCGNPNPPRRSSSLNRIPPEPPRNKTKSAVDTPSTLPHYRARSPAAMELERVTRTLNMLKAEVDSILTIWGCWAYQGYLKYAILALNSNSYFCYSPSKSEKRGPEIAQKYEFELRAKIAYLRSPWYAQQPHMYKTSTSNYNSGTLPAQKHSHYLSTTPDIIRSLSPLIERSTGSSSPLDPRIRSPRSPTNSGTYNWNDSPLVVRASPRRSDPSTPRSSEGSTRRSSSSDGRRSPGEWNNSTLHRRSQSPTDRRSQSPGAGRPDSPAGGSVGSGRRSPIAFRNSGSILVPEVWQSTERLNFLSPPPIRRSPSPTPSLKSSSTTSSKSSKSSSEDLVGLRKPTKVYSKSASETTATDAHPLYARRNDIRYTISKPSVHTAPTITLYRDGVVSPFQPISLTDTRLIVSSPREGNYEITDSPRPYSPYHPDKTPYYRARYHSEPQSPTGQNDATTSTTDILNPRSSKPFTPKEAPIKETKRSKPLTLSTHTLEVPNDDLSTPLFTLEMETETLSDASPTVSNSRMAPVQNLAPVQNRFYDMDHYESECDLGAGVSSFHMNVNQGPGLPKREEQLLTPPPLPPREGEEEEGEEGQEGVNGITLKGENLFDPFHIGTTYVILSRQNHGRFKFSTTPDPNRSLPGSPRGARSARSVPSPDLMPPGSPASSFRGRSPNSTLPRGVGSPNSTLPRGTPGGSPARELSPGPGPVIRPIQAATTRATPINGDILHSPVAVMPPKRELYKPRSLAGSLASLNLSKTDLNKNGGRPGSSFSPPLIPPRTRDQSVPRSPEQQLRKFNRPVKEPAFREVAVDVPNAPPPVINTRKPSIQEVEMEKKNPAARQYHLQNLSSPNSSFRSSSPSNNKGNSLRRKIPEVRMLGGEWKELAQRLGYDNSHIASFSVDYPNPGQALLDHWSKQRDANLDELLYHMKDLGLWKTADTLDKTFDDIAVNRPIRTRYLGHVTGY